VSARVLVAGVGNIFLGDDGFGVEVARRLRAAELPEGVRVADFGIRGVHLAYELLDGYQTAILVDATPRGGEPGTVYVIEPEPPDGAGGHTLLDAHGMEPDAVLSMLEVLGGSDAKLLIVGCEPADVQERIGLSPRVAGAVEEAVTVVRELVDAETAGHERGEEG
jgi:hydrogenase maturation protease